jgi:very-short-patch-repair endonuclease
MTRSHRKASDALRRQGETHRNEVRFHAPGWPYGYRADIYLPRHRVLIEIDGPSHHGRERRDRMRDARFRRDLGIRTVRITNSEIERNEDRAIRQVLSNLYR